MPADVGLTAAELEVEALMLDRCTQLLVFAVDAPFDALAGSDTAIEIPPGGYCAIHALMDDARADLVLTGVADGRDWTEALELGSIAALEPFEIDDGDVLLVIRYGDLLADDRGPVVAEVWRDLDADGLPDDPAVSDP